MYINKKFRIVMISIVTFILMFIVLLIMPRGLLVDEEKMSAISMFEKLEKDRLLIELCLLKGDGCKQNNVPTVMTERNFTYITASSYDLIGLDKKNDVLVLLHPEISESNISWICDGHPASKMPIKCNVINAHH